MDYRHKIKERSVYVMGGKCQCCGYNRSLRALHFHHIDESTKSFSISDTITRNWQDTKEELKKCVLVCSNCHMEIHDGILECPSTFIDEEKVLEIDAIVALNKKQYHYCPECGVEVYQKGSLCLTCAGKKRRKVEHPSREELKDLIRNNSFTKLGQKYGVSDNSIRKWCKNYNLPHSSKVIKSYTEEEWFNI